MGLYDTVRVKGLQGWTCSEGHDLMQAEWQTQDLGCTMGSWTLAARLDGTPGFEGERIELPLTDRIAIYTHCIQCPALFDELDVGGNVILPSVEFEVDLVESVVRRAERVSESTPEHLARWIERYGCEGPMTYAEAVATQITHVPDRARSLRRFLTKLVRRAFRAEPSDVEILARLIREEPTLVHARDAIGRTPLHHLIEQIRADPPSRPENVTLEALAELVLLKGGDPNARDEKGLTALFLASTPRAAALLVRHGARVNEANHQGNTALMHAVHDPKLFDALLNLGADPHQVNSSGHSAHTWKMLDEGRKT
ncbi:ankyrin repeat domain-containing protein [Polyangium sorediatum]|uniref:Ankyrin repeat domain-containing protein n=1 Tax=Polyangium sorediatum TaxID=889274 RepID=A0ABT6NQS5_9BACT|nr:ankyrin repeat domain-containing protein [Polyangium sorediatum]MDI1430691.1 ankyrin repeat domain-containing protein [Polyangium sorediatum]